MRSRTPSRFRSSLQEYPALERNIPPAGSHILISPPPPSRFEALAHSIRQRPWTFHLLVALLFAVATVISLRPLLVNAADHISHKPAGDQLWQATVLDAQLRALLTDPGAYLSANFFYGSGNALYGSDLWVGLLALFAPIRLLSGNPILAFNVTWHLAFALNAFLMYLAVLTITRNRWAALVAGTVFGFGALQINYAQMHFNYAGAWWIPLTLLFSVRFARSRRWPHFALAILCVWLQFLTVVTLSYIAGFVFLTFAIVPGLWWPLRNRDWLLPLQMLAAAGVVTALFFPFVLGYLEFARDWNAQRDLSEVQNGSLQLRDYLSPSSRLAWYEPMQNRFPVPTGERRAFPGFIPLAIGLLGGLIGLYRVLHRRSPRCAFSGYAIAAGVLFLLAIILSLGPNWKWHETVTDFQLPYRFLYDNFPNFRAVRIVARFSLMANFALALLAGVLVAALTARFRETRQLAPALALLISAAVFIESATVPLNVLPVPRDADLTTLLATAPDGPLLFVPVSGGDEVQRIWLTTSAGKGPLVNGYSGAIWPQYWYFRDATRDVTRQTAPNLLGALRVYGIRALLIDTSVLPERDLQIWQNLSESVHVSSTADLGPWLLLNLPIEVPKIHQQWSDLDIYLPLEAAPAGQSITVPIAFSNPSPSPWLPPSDSTVRTLTARWLDADGNLAFQSTAPLLPPPFIAAGDSHDTLLELQTPTTDGLYTLHLEAPEAQLLVRNVRIGDITAKAFHGTGEGLRARLRLITQNTYQGRPTERFPLLVTALNLGPVTWSADANIRLGWRWFKVGEDGAEVEVPGYEGRIVLLSHLVGPVLPGNGYAFSDLLRLPDEPGEYVVRVAPLAELVAWFPGDPALIRVTVLAD